MRKGLFVILGLCVLAVSVSMATPSPTARYLIERLDNVELLAGAYRPFVAARPITATQIDDSLFGLVPDSMAWVSRSNAFLVRCTFAKPIVCADTVKGANIVGTGTLNIAGASTFGGAVGITGAVTATTLAVGGGSTLAKLVYKDAGDSVLLFIVGTDTFKARK